MKRIGHPDWVKLSVELNCAPNQNTKFPFHYKFILVVLFFNFWISQREERTRKLVIFEDNGTDSWPPGCR